MTDPRPILETISLVMSLGAGLPGIRAVVMTTSFFSIRLPISSSSFRCVSPETSFA